MILNDKYDNRRILLKFFIGCIWWMVLLVFGDVVNFIILE